MELGTPEALRIALTNNIVDIAAANGSRGSDQAAVTADAGQGRLDIDDDSIPAAQRTPPSPECDSASDDLDIVVVSK